MARRQPGFPTLRERAGLSIREVASRADVSERTVYRWENGETRPRQPVLDLLRTTAGKKTAGPGNARFTFIDLFAGIGGLRIGFDAIGGKCVFTSEWDKYAQRTYRANFSSDHNLEGDITRIHAGDIPAHDVLLAGFPCQPFSIAGVSKKNALRHPHGFRCETQGTLFFDVVRILKHHRPKFFLLENVRNLANHDKGRTFEIIRKTLREDLGYKICWRVLNAKLWVPQNRERIFIAGFREDTSFTLNNMRTPDLLKAPRLDSILHGARKFGPEQPYTDAAGHAHKKYALSDHLWKYLQDYAARHRRQGNGFGFGIVGPDDIARTLSARYFKDGSEILVRRKGRNPRRLTPRECARLMGFDYGRRKFIIPPDVSDTQAYKQFGNAVVVPVAEAVARHMEPWIIADETASGRLHVA